MWVVRFPGPFKRHPLLITMCRGEVVHFYFYKRSVISHLANFAPARGSVKQETLVPEGDDGVVVISDQAAAPYFATPHGEGFRLLVRDTKDLKAEDINFLLTLLVVNHISRGQTTDVSKS